MFAVVTIGPLFNHTMCNVYFILYTRAHAHSPHKMIERIHIGWLEEAMLASCLQIKLLVAKALHGMLAASRLKANWFKNYAINCGWLLQAQFASAASKLECMPGKWYS